MHARAETEQVKRIRKAVEEAARRRDKYADENAEELFKALEASSARVAKQIEAFERQAAMKEWQSMRLAILKDLEKNIDTLALELYENWKVGVRARKEGALKLGIEAGLEQLRAADHSKFRDLSDVAQNALVKRTFSQIDQAGVDFLANYEVQLLGDVSRELATGIKRTVTQGVLEGRSIRDVTRDIGRTIKDPDEFRKAGKTVFKSAQQRAELIARTETLRAHNEGGKVFLREVGVKKIKWLTAHDERTCPECAPLDGRIFNMDDAPGPPKHPGCRCTYLSVLED